MACYCVRDFCLSNGEERMKVAVGVCDTSDGGVRKGVGVGNSPLFVPTHS